MNISKMSTPCNPDASNEVKTVLEYLSDLAGEGIIIGQHTQTMVQEELNYIHEVTGKIPALCGFELLAYSPNINYDTCDEACLKEINENKGTIEKAWEWADRKGLITFCWHWYSPLGGWDKAFYTKNTDFDATQAIIPGTKENIALISDMDYVAELLKPFCEKKIPIMWRPFHEGDGHWFWWGAKGPEVLIALYRLMYERYTKIHNLNNLIWVWNSPESNCYPGDDVTDVISRDMYPPAHCHDDHKLDYDELAQITKTQKICAIGEIGTMPSVTKLSESRVNWTSFMIWSNEYGKTEEFTTKDELYKAYQHPYAITLEKLPKLY